MEHESIETEFQVQVGPKIDGETWRWGMVKTMIRREVRRQTRGYMAVCVVSAVLGATATLISLAVLLGWL